MKKTNALTRALIAGALVVALPGCALQGGVYEVEMPAVGGGTTTTTMPVERPDVTETDATPEGPAIADNDANPEVGEPVDAAAPTGVAPTPLPDVAQSTPETTPLGGVPTEARFGLNPSITDGSSLPANLAAPFEGEPPVADAPPPPPPQAPPQVAPPAPAAEVMPAPEDMPAPEGSGS